MIQTEIMKMAKKAMEMAYIPYSNFAVGAAVRTKKGTIYTGCNIENAAYPVSCCAERVAIFKAIANGEREFSEIAVIADTPQAVSPCGSCRQVMSEFFTQSTAIHLANLNGDIKTVTMGELLPFSFKADDMV